MAIGSKVKGITIEFNGDTNKLGRAMKEINAEAKDVDKSLREVNRALKFNPGNTELLAQKQTLLKEKIQQTKKQLDALKQAEATMTANGVDKQSHEFMELQREIIETESKVKHFEKEVRKLNNVDLSALSTKLKDAGEKVKNVGASMTQYVTVPLVAGFTVAGKAASDYEENLNKLDVAFGSNSESVRNFTDNALESYGLSKVAASDAAASFGALGKGIGLTDDQAAQTATTLTGLSADLASYFNTGTDESAKALEGIFTGESEALKRFGVVMNDTNLEQFAADQGKVWKEMDQTEKTMLRYEYVLSKTGDAQGDYSRTSDGTANSFKTLKGALEDLATAIGTQLLPIITPIVRKITELIKKFASLPKPVQKVITVIGLVVAAAGPLLMIIGGIISAIGNLIIFGPIIMSTILGVIGPIMAALAPVLPFILLIVAAVIALFLIIKNWDKIKEFLIKVWNAIKNAAQTVWEAIKFAITAPIKAVWFVIQTVWNAIKTFFTTIWNAIKQAAQTAWEAIQNVIVNPIKKAYQTIQNVVERIRNIITTGFEAIKNTAQRVWEAIKNAITAPIERAKQIVQNAINFLRNLFPLKIGKIFNIKLPHFSWDWLNIGGMFKLPKIKIDWYKNGGIFDSPTIAGIGEAGAEAVVPLDQFWSKMDRIADAVSGGGDQIQIIVNASPGMDVNALADAVQQRLVRLQKQRDKAWA